MYATIGWRQAVSLFYRGCPLLRVSVIGSSTVLPSINSHVKNEWFSKKIVVITISCSPTSARRYSDCDLSRYLCLFCQRNLIANRRL